MFQAPLACPCGGATGLSYRQTSSTHTRRSISWLRNTRRRFWVCFLDPYPPWWSTTTTASDRCSPDPNSRAESKCPSLTCERTTKTWVRISQLDKGNAIPYSPGQALRFPGGWGSHISRKSAHKSGKVGCLTHRPPLPQEIFLVLISVRGWVERRTTVKPKGLCQRKIPLTPSRFKPTVFGLWRSASTNSHGMRTFPKLLSLMFGKIFK